MNSSPSSRGRVERPLLVGATCGSCSTVDTSAVTSVPYPVYPDCREAPSAKSAACHSAGLTAGRPAGVRLSAIDPRTRGCRVSTEANWRFLRTTHE